ncbi:MAG: pantetheine-phosphate adenylyltransferase [Paludibacteraceae bacterium]|nr:pantetheine-phosphate adenylyltransferase [Paludibacteraceae bacterium]
MKRAIFPGTFDPFTIGHQDIVLRALPLFDEIIIAIGTNHLKSPTFSEDKRLQDIKHAFANEPRVKVALYEGLTIDFAKQVDAHIILRGVRCVVDFEYERSMAEANRELAGEYPIETVILYTSPQYAHISSTLIRDLQKHQQDISKYLPK